MIQTVKPGTNFDFVGKRKYFTAISGLLVLASLALFFIRGPTWGIDFTGGTEIRMRFDEPIGIDEVRGAIERLGFGGDAVQQVGGDEEAEYVVRIQDPTFGSSTAREDVEAALKKRFGDDWISEVTLNADVGSQMTVRYHGSQIAFTDVADSLASVKGVTPMASLDENAFYVKLPSAATNAQALLAAELPNKKFEVLQVDSVGPKVGGELRRQGFIALLATMGLLLVYVAFRFDLAFAPGAIIALFHDIVLTVGFLIVLDMTGIYTAQFDLSIVGVLLTILGFSINDTIVIYDRIRENERKFRRKNLAQLINDSVNETLSRTLNTSTTAIIAILPFMIVGGPVIRTFAIAMTFGMITGVYSTVYIASPLVLIMQDVKPYLNRLISPKVSGVLEGEGAGGAELTESARRRQEREARNQERRGSD